MKRSVVAILLAGVAAMAGAQAPSIKIYGSLDLSGPAADVGRDALAGIQYAIDVVNRSGGVLGRPLVLEHQDNGSNPQRAVNQASALIANGAPLLISPQSSAGAIAVNKAVTSKNTTPTCVSTSVADDMTMKDFNPFIFSVTPNSYMEGRALAARFAKLPYRRYAVVSADYAGGRSGVRRFMEFLKEMKPDVEFVAEEYPKFGATDYTASINKLLAAKPDYVFTILFGADLLTFSKQANAVGFFKQIDNKFIALYDFNTLKALGENAAIGTEGWQRAPANHLVKSPQGKQFVDQFRAKTGSYPSDWTAMTYDCVMLWAQAANTARSLDGAAVMRVIESGQFASPRGAIRFAKYDHQADVPSYIGVVEQSRDFGQPVLNIVDVMPASVSRPSEATVMKIRGQ